MSTVSAGRLLEALRQLKQILGTNGHLRSEVKRLARRVDIEVKERVAWQELATERMKERLEAEETLDKIRELL